MPPPPPVPAASPRMLAELAELGRLQAGQDYRSAPLYRSLLAAWTRLAQRRRLAVFAYGSLLWHCDFEPARQTPARLHGFSRQACIYSTHYRGTPQRPGLVLGLRHGGSCSGVALELPVAQAAAALEALFERELFQGVYYPRLVRARAPAGRRTILSLAFIANPASPAYAPDLKPAAVRRIIAAARGRRGKCRDYWSNTCAQLRAHGFAAGALERLLPD